MRWRPEVAARTGWLRPHRGRGTHVVRSGEPSSHVVSDIVEAPAARSSLLASTVAPDEWAAAVTSRAAAAWFPLGRPAVRLS